MKLGHTEPDGTAKPTVVDPYGFFTLRDITYCVATEDSDGQQISDHLKNLSGGAAPQSLTRQSYYGILKSFGAADFKVLSCQIRTTIGTAHFILKQPVEELLETLQRYAILTKHDANTYQRAVEVSS